MNWREEVSSTFVQDWVWLIRVCNVMLLLLEKTKKKGDYSSTNSLSLSLIE